jgi:hypothetical protein
MKSECFSTLMSALLLFVCQPIGAQNEDHAPTLAQCHADRMLWTEQVIEYNNAEAQRLKNRTPNNSVIWKLPISKLIQRQDEMGDCEAVDPENVERYDDVLRNLLDAYKTRYVDFVVRHKLDPQLLKEDEAGLR